MLLRFGMIFPFAEPVFEGKSHSKQHVIEIWNDFSIIEPPLKEKGMPLLRSTQERHLYVENKN
jgi:hypothetical protein